MKRWSSHSVLAAKIISKGAFQLLTCKSANRDQHRPLVADAQQADQGRVRARGGEDREPLKKQELDEEERERDQNQKDFVRRAVSNLLRSDAVVNLWYVILPLIVCTVRIPSTKHIMTFLLDAQNRYHLGWFQTAINTSEWFFLLSWKYPKMWQLLSLVMKSTWNLILLLFSTKRYK